MNNVHPMYREMHRARLNTADTIYAGLFISVAIVIALFFADHGISEMSTQSGLWTAIGQITGLIATDLLLIQLILASRLPLIDRAIGHDRAIGVHQQLGKPVLILLTLHAITLTIGYGLADKLSFIPEAISMIKTIPDIITAILGFLLICTIVISSIVIIRKRIDYDLWFIIHLTAYIAVIASIPHQFSAGAIFGEGTIARWYWLGLYILAAGSILIFRFITPVIFSLRHSLVVSEIRQESKGVITVTITGKNINDLKVQAGQFFIWRFLESGLWWHAHPFSLSASPKADSLRITIRALGNGSEKIQNIKLGTRVAIEGPYGIFTENTRTSKNLVLIAAGIGITPIRALLEEANFEPGTATVIIRKTNQDEYLIEEVEKLAKQRGAKLHILSGPRSKDLNRWTPDASTEVHLDSLVHDLRKSDLYVCGPAHWSRLVVKDAKQLGMSKHQIHWERFNW